MAVSRRLKNELRFGFWFSLCVLNGVSIAVSTRIGVTNWISIASFILSLAYAIHYSRPERP